MNSSVQLLSKLGIIEVLGTKAPLLHHTAAHPSLSSSRPEETLAGTVKHTRVGKEVRMVRGPRSGCWKGDACAQASPRRH